MTGGQLDTTTRGLVNWNVDTCAYAASGSDTACTVLRPAITIDRTTTPAM